MYKLLKKYKNLENHNIKTQVLRVVRMEERAVIVKFYPDNFFENNFLNFCPIEQQDFIFEYFELEEIVRLHKNEIYRPLSILHPDYWMVGKIFKAPIQNSLLNIEPDLSKFSLNKLALNYYFKIYKKYFIRLEKKYRFEILNRVKLIFLSRNLRQIIISYNITKSSYKILYKKFLHKCLLITLCKLDEINKKISIARQNFDKNKNFFNKKNILKKKPAKKFFYLCFNGISKKGLFFRVPGILEPFFLSYKYWIPKECLISFKNQLKWYTHSFFKLSFHSMEFSEKNPDYLKFTVKWIDNYKEIMRQFNQNFLKKVMKNYKKAKKKFHKKIKSKKKVIIPQYASYKKKIKTVWKLSIKNQKIKS